MEILKPKAQMKIHLYLSLFFLPLALIYAVTGVGYILGFHHNAGAKVKDAVLERTDYAANAQERADTLLALAEKYGLELPAQRDPRALRNGNAVVGGLAHFIVFASDKDGKQFLRSIERNPYGVAVMLHKAHGKPLVAGLTAFDLLGIGFGVTLFLLYFSGVVVIGLRRLRSRAAVACIGAGVVVTAVAVGLTIGGL